MVKEKGDKHQQQLPPPRAVVRSNWWQNNGDKMDDGEERFTETDMTNSNGFNGSNIYVFAYVDARLPTYKAKLLVNT